MGDNDRAEMLRSIERLSRLMAEGQGLYGWRRTPQNTESVNEPGNEIEEAQPDEKAARTEREELRIVKAAIPFIDPKRRGRLALAVKIIEMSDGFNYGEESGTDDDDPVKRREKMLEAIREQLPQDRAEKIDLALRIMDAGRFISEPAQKTKGEL